MGDATVTPISRCFSLGLPGWLSANQSKGFTFIYQQPAALRIERDGQISEVPIRDFQNIARLSSWLAILVGILILARKFHKEKTNE